MNKSAYIIEVDRRYICEAIGASILGFLFIWVFARPSQEKESCVKLRGHRHKIRAVLRPPVKEVK